MGIARVGMENRILAAEIKVPRQNEKGRSVICNSSFSGFKYLRLRTIYVCSVTVFGGERESCDHCEGSWGLHWG